jgi:uncharacterized tellurite resistance protein B-like protein
MTIVAALAAAFAVVVALLIRMQSAAHAVRDIADAASDTRGLFRGFLWRRKFAKTPLELVDDPREGAVAMMVMLAESDGVITERERTAVMNGTITTFGATAAQAEQLFAQGRFLARDVKLAEAGFRRLQPLIAKRLGAAERRQLIDILTAVANAEGQPGLVEQDAIDKLALALNVGRKPH